jgi:hypothetical protein
LLLASQQPADKCQDNECAPYDCDWIRVVEAGDDERDSADNKQALHTFTHFGSLREIPKHISALTQSAICDCLVRLREFYQPTYPVEMIMISSWPFSRMLTFNMVMSVVSVLVLAEKLFDLIVARSLTPGGLMALIWIVIAYHFISVSYRGYKQEQQRESDGE